MFSSSSSSYLIHALSSLWPLSSIQLTGFAAAFVQWDISINSSATWLLVVLFLPLLPFYRKKILFVPLFLFPFWIVLDQKLLQDIVETMVKPMECRSSSLILFLLCFLGCCFLGCLKYFQYLPPIVN